MTAGSPRWPKALALFACILGLVFAGYSTLDYVQHLDRQVHDIHCSFIPGLEVDKLESNPCRVALFSPYAALFRDRYWGGIPISLFALGAFSFFAAFALYALLANDRAPRRTEQFLGIVGCGPLVVSIAMAIISATKLGQFCKTCVGIYASSLLLAIGGLAALQLSRRETADFAADRTLPATMVDDPSFTPEPRRLGGILLVPAWLVALALFTVTPALLYVSALPNYSSLVAECGKLDKPVEPNGALLKITPPGARQPATLFVDPLCPTCKALHQRLVADHIFSQLDTTLVLFPLDSECNWMLDRPVHPGACLVSKAIICADHRALSVLEWSYDHQAELLESAKAGAGVVNVRAALRERWPDLDSCIDAKDTKIRLDRMLRHIVANQLPVSTPQMFLGETRLCDEDTDIGLAYSLHKLAPSLRRE